MEDAIADGMPILNAQKAIENLGDESLFNTLIESYDSALIKTLEELQVAMDKIDYKEIRMKSHSLKGPSSYIGAERVRRAAEILQFNVDKQEGLKIYKNYPMLMEECIKLRRQIRVYLCTQRRNEH